MRIRNQLVIAAAAFVAAVTTASAQTVTAYQEGFGAAGSVLNTPTQAPNGTSTSYTIWSSTSLGNTMNSGDLNVQIAATGGGNAEAQALFTTSPFSAAVSGDWIDLQITFVDTAIWNSSNNGSYLYMGLFNSGGVAPLATPSTAFTTGGVQNWLGYSASFGNSGTTTKILSRPAQTAGVDQDLFGNNVSSSRSYNSPTATQLVNGAGKATGTMTSGQTYTMNLKILNVGGTMTVNADLYAGVGTGGTDIDSVDGATDASAGVSTFDGMGFMWYQKGSQATTMDVTALSVTEFTQVPEPSTLILLGMGLAAIARLVWRRR